VQLISSCPWWFIIFCVLAGLVYAYILYKPKWKNGWSKVLFIVRFLAVSFISFFLLAPVLVQKISTVQKPIIIMAMDNSQSVLANKDSNYYKTAMKQAWLNAKQVLGSDYDIQYISFGNKPTPNDSLTFNEKRSNIGELYTYINNAFVKQNVGAVIMASDGIYNVGTNPIYKKLENNAVLYTLGIGDSSVKKDVIIKDINTNAIAYLGNDFPLEINLAAFSCMGSNAILNISSEGKNIYSKAVNYTSNDFYQNIVVNITADKPGTKHIVATLSLLEGEVSKINNRKDVFIEIIDGREKILLAYNGSHPDIGALKEAIQTNVNYEVIAKSMGEIKVSDIQNYSVVILHQLPSRTFPIKEMLNACKLKQIPIWCIVGGQSAIDYLPNVLPAARIDRGGGRTNEVQGLLNANFNTFTLEDNTKQTLASLPPMKSPYGNYSATGMDILSFQKISGIDTKIPLWAFSNMNGEKTAFTFGEGFWQWRMVDFVKNENHLATNELVSKTIQYLAVKEDKRKFRVYPIKNVYEEDEAVKFVAELYNSNYELVNTTDVKLTLSNENNKAFEYTFSPSNKAYQLELGLLPAGIYTYKAIASGIKEVIIGKLLVKPLQSELINTRANFSLLRQMAVNSNGKFYTINNLNGALKAVKENTTITSVSYKEKKIEDLINVKGLFFLILAFLALEWFVRKYEGGY